MKIKSFAGDSFRENPVRKVGEAKSKSAFASRRIRFIRGMFYFDSERIKNAVRGKVGTRFVEEHANEVIHGNPYSLMDHRAKQDFRRLARIAFPYFAPVGFSSDFLGNEPMELLVDVANNVDNNVRRSRELTAFGKRFQPFESWNSFDRISFPVGELFKKKNSVTVSLWDKVFSHLVEKNPFEVSSRLFKHFSLK